MPNLLGIVKFCKVKTLYRPLAGNFTNIFSTGYLRPFLNFNKENACRKDGRQNKKPSVQKTEDFDLVNYFLILKIVRSFAG